MPLGQLAGICASRCVLHYSSKPSFVPSMLMDSWSLFWPPSVHQALKTSVLPVQPFSTSAPSLPLSFKDFRLYRAVKASKPPFLAVSDRTSTALDALSHNPHSFAP